MTPPQPIAEGKCPKCGHDWEEHDFGVPAPYCPIPEPSDPITPTAPMNDSRDYHQVMSLLRSSKMQHGLCKPRERRACTACNAQEKLDKLVAEYKGAPIRAQSAPTANTKENAERLADSIMRKAEAMSDSFDYSTSLEPAIAAMLESAITEALAEKERELRELRGAIACHEISPEAVRELRNAVAKSSVIPRADKEVPLLARLNYSEQQLTAERERVKKFGTMYLPNADSHMVRTANNLGQNGLEPVLLGTRSFRKSKRKPLVSIAIGLICRDGIILASDSRTTHPDHSVRDDAQKIQLLNLKDGKGALIAQSGDDDLGARILENIALSAQEKTLSDWQSVSEIADAEILKEQLKLKAPFVGPGYTDEGFRDILRGFDLSLIIGHHHNGRPYLFTSDFYPGRATPKKAQFVSIGCGSSLANFLLDSFDLAGMNFILATVTAIYIIEEVKKFDPRCEGKTKVAWDIRMNLSDRDVLTTVIGDEMVEDISSAISKLRGRIKSESKTNMSRILREVVQSEEQKKAFSKKAAEGLKP